ncbi:FecR family protein [Sinomicrobium soli]|uniref:FecR family protein n=1 Tax=Sinomicrobium sp. N-1-3-6 TaxID=2219864 RepID=UPI000DCC6B0F|nr:FecR domain-containing protein [Sinomicrobium sp. N-1-3-6]RAV28488.1 anti-sigma factor [Sinomicrobium sp. N-1-3-6]
MKYKNYSGDDFLKDDDFLMWICAPDPESDAFWKAFLLQHPEKSGTIAAARKKAEEYGRLAIYDERQKYSRATSEAVYSAIVQGVEQADRTRKISGKTFPFSRLWAVAASMVVLLSAGWYFYRYVQDAGSPEDRIEAGSSKAVLTLSDGSEVLLQQGTDYISGRASSDGTSVIYRHAVAPEKEMAYNELTIPRGGEFFLLLSDSTKVWLNSETRIRYPESFTDGKPREVALLYGEAYFEVSPAAKHGGNSFKVRTKNQEIEVLGTQFNITAYPEDHGVTSTLIEGEVAVTAGNVRKELQPGQQAVAAKNNTITVKEVEVFTYTAWKEGYFGFRSKPLAEVMNTLSRWYDVNIIIENPELEKIRFNGMLDRKQSIKEILSMIDHDIRFDIRERNITIY